MRVPAPSARSISAPVASSRHGATARAHVPPHAQASKRHPAHRPRVAQAGAGREGVELIEGTVIILAQDGGQTALGVAGLALAKPAVRQQAT